MLFTLLAHNTMWHLFDILCFALFIYFSMYIHVMLALRSVKVLLESY